MKYILIILSMSIAACTSTPDMPLASDGSAGVAPSGGDASSDSKSITPNQAIAFAQPTADAIASAVKSEIVKPTSNSNGGHVVTAVNAASVMGAGASAIAKVAETDPVVKSLVLELDKVLEGDPVDGARADALRTQLAAALKAAREALSSVAGFGSLTTVVSIIGDTKSVAGHTERPPTDAESAAAGAAYVELVGKAADIVAEARK